MELDDVGDVDEGLRTALIHCLVPEDREDELTVSHQAKSLLPFHIGRVQVPLAVGVVALQVHRVYFLHIPNKINEN